MAEVDTNFMIIEYRNDKPYRTWNGIKACARAHGIGAEMLKCLIATGATLYTDASISFDLDAECPYRYVMKNVNGRMKAVQIKEK